MILKLRRAVLGVLIVVAAGVSGCSHTITLPPYTPISTEELSGAVSVNDFKYFPKGNMAQDVIHTTTMDTVHVTDSVPAYITNAVKRELRQAGISIKSDSGCKLDGEVNDFTIDDLGWSATFKSDIRYILWDRDQKPLLDNTYQDSFKTDKFTAPELVLASINKMVSDNVGKLMSDPAFQEALDHCPKT